MTPAGPPLTEETAPGHHGEGRDPAEKGGLGVHHDLGLQQQGGSLESGSDEHHRSDGDAVGLGLRHDQVAESHDAHEDEDQRPGPTRGRQPGDADREDGAGDAVDGHHQAHVGRLAVEVLFQQGRGEHAEHEPDHDGGHEEQQHQAERAGAE